MGAAGLTSSSAEMAARGGVGIELETSRVPLREPGMTPYEIMLSESQERMLVVAEPYRVAEIQAVCARWDLPATPVGRVTDDGDLPGAPRGQCVAAIPAQRLVDGCPTYHPIAREDPAARPGGRPSPPQPPRADVLGALPLLLDDPTIASKRWVYEQYDSTVQGATVLPPGGDAGVFLVPGESFGVAVTVDGNQRYVALDPCEGGKAAVAEAARNIACTGAIPLGITDCLNFGNPEKPGVFYQFREACRGISDACRAFETPVTGGNVSLYNESPSGAIDPTPVIGMVGLLPEVRRRVPSHFQNPGDLIVLLGITRGHLGGSSYWEVIRNLPGGSPPPVDLAVERRLQRFLAAAAHRGLLRSAHDCSDGGLAVALAECCIGAPYAERPLGAWVELARADGPAEAVLYGEDMRAGGHQLPSRKPPCPAAAGERVRHPGGRSRKGRPPGGNVGDPPSGGSPSFAWPVAELRRIYFDALPRRMEAAAALGCAGSSAYPRFTTRRGSPISDSTPSSTVARKAPASSRWNGNGLPQSSRYGAGQ